MENVRVENTKFVTVGAALGSVLADALSYLLEGSVGSTITITVGHGGIVTTYQPPLFPEDLPRIGDALVEDKSARVIHGCVQRVLDEYYMRLFWEEFVDDDGGLVGG